MLSRFIYTLFVKLFSRLGLYKVRYTTYVSIAIDITKLLKKPMEGILCADLGCGPGTIARQLSRTCDIMLGVDIEDYGSSWIRGGSPTLFFVAADARRLPIRSEALNVVTAISLLEHVPRWDRVIEEAGRTLKGGGLLLIQVPNLWFPLEPHTKFPLLAYLPKSLKKLSRGARASRIYNLTAKSAG